MTSKQLNINQLRSDRQKGNNPGQFLCVNRYKKLQNKHTLIIRTILLGISILFLLSGCHQNTEETNCFLITQDTLIIEAKTLAGTGLFRKGASPLIFRDTSEWTNNNDWSDFTFNYPKELDSIQLGFSSVMLLPLRFFDNNGDDTIQINTERADNSIAIVTGVNNGKETIVVDENNNGDLTDDQFYDIEIWDWHEEGKLIKCSYDIDNGCGLMSDTGWIRIGRYNSRILISSYQHAEANLSIEGIEYKIGILDYNPSSFCFISPQIALLEENGVERDSLFDRDIIRKKEFIKLGKEYYSFHDFYSGSKTLILIKEKDFSNKIGVQVGANAPMVVFKDNEDDTLNLKLLNNKPILVANISGCSPRSYDIYEELYKATSNSLNIIGINSGIKEGLSGTIVNVEDGFNKDIYKHYRNAYSSYNCYIIDVNGRIDDKFDIFDWEMYLEQYVRK